MSRSRGCQRGNISPRTALGYHLLLVEYVGDETVARLYPGETTEAPEELTLLPAQGPAIHALAIPRRLVDEDQGAGDGGA
jgi:hypothetical protein